jgi:hypothetical protein
MLEGGAIVGSLRHTLVVLIADRCSEGKEGHVARKTSGLWRRKDYKGQDAQEEAFVVQLTNRVRDAPTRWVDCLLRGWGW